MSGVIHGKGNRLVAVAKGLVAVNQSVTAIINRVIELEEQYKQIREDVALLRAQFDLQGIHAAPDMPANPAFNHEFKGGKRDSQ